MSVCALQTTGVAGVPWDSVPAFSALPGGFNYAPSPFDTRFQRTIPAGREIKKKGGVQEEVEHVLNNRNELLVSTI